MSDKEKIEILEKSGFFYHNDYHIVELTKNSVILRANLSEKSMNPYGFAHGGLIFGLGDTAMGLATSMTGKNGVTLNANINYLKTGKGKYIQAKAKIIKEGKHTCNVCASIYDDKDNLIATMDSNYYYID